jgi:hemerythrin-like domain-containing protein
MLPIGPLMIEHRLIERVIRIMKALVEEMEAGKRAVPDQVGTIIHFIKSYADRCHHGKEEEILFRELSRKPLSAEHKRIMDELIEDHRRGRELTLSLFNANQRYRGEDATALSEITRGFRSLIEFYPRHIEKEDRHFFIPVMSYFGPEEKEAMIRAGYESDSRLLHEEFVDLIKGLEVKK